VDPDQVVGLVRGPQDITSVLDDDVAIWLGHVEPFAPDFRDGRVDFNAIDRDRAVGRRQLLADGAAGQADQEGTLDTGLTGLRVEEWPDHEIVPRPTIERGGWVVDRVGRVTLIERELVGRPILDHLDVVVARLGLVDEDATLCWPDCTTG